MNSSFVFLRPEVCTKAFVDFTLEFFQHANIRVDDVAVISTDEARRRGWIEQHYATTRTFAYADSCTLTSLIGDRREVKSVFHAFFRELWDTVVAEGRLLTAKDAMAVLGNLTPRELSQRWWGNGDFHPVNTTTAAGCAPVKLFSGLYVIRLAQEGNLYVVNGFYPAIHEACTAEEGKSMCRLTVSWPEAAFTWEQFAADIIGRPGDPNASRQTGCEASKAATDTYPMSSLRYALYHHGDALGVRMVKDAWAAPSRAESAPVVMSGLEAAAGPLEALAARCLWVGVAPEDDDFGRQLLQEGVPLCFVHRLLANPVLLQSGEVIAAFDITAGLTSSQAVRLISELYVEAEARECDADGEDRPGALHILDVLPTTAPPGSTSDHALRDSAVLLVKPHACKAKVFALVEEVLAREADEHGLTVDSSVDIDADLAEAKALVDRHYGLEAFYAMSIDPASIPVASAEEEAFFSTFGICWADALAAGRVLNAPAALHVLGGLTAAQLYQHWFVEEEKLRKVKLASGAWVCRVVAAAFHKPHHSELREAATIPVDKDQPFFVVNGFYPYLRETFTAPGAKTRCLAISWPEASEESESSTSLGTARLESALRDHLTGRLKVQWQELDLSHPLDTVNDTFVLSRGAAEAAVMRHVWLGVPLEEDVRLYGDALRPRGVSVAPLMRWLANPLVTSSAAVEKQRVLDLLAGNGTSEIVRVAREAEQQLRDSATSVPVNRAVVLLYPPAATAKAIQHVRGVLSRGGFDITAEGDAFSREASARLLGTADMRATAQLAALGGDQLFDAVPAEAKEAFRRVYKKDWVEFTEIVTGAAVACRELEVSPTALMKKWSDCSPVRLSRHCHVAFVPAFQRYVVNGFYPYLEERYTSPGARAHYFHVEWRESRWTWADFSNVVVGNRDIARAAAGSLQRSISEGWRELGLPERPCHRAQVSIAASTGPLDAIADRVVWPAPGSLTDQRLEDRFLADPVAQRLVAEGVPMGMVAYFAAGYQHLSLDDTRAQERALLQDISTHQQTSECVRRLKTVAANIQSAGKQHYGFFWLQPACATPDVAAAIPELLAAYRVRIRSQGELSVEEAAEKALLNGPLTALYRNAWVREAAGIPITEAEKAAFLSFFGIAWETAVQLSTVINAKEAARRFGETRILDWWDKTPRKVCLSPDLYVGFLELEGVYVVNGFYPYVQSRLHAGSRRTMWFSVTWDAAQLSWDEFQERVVGAQDPAQAADGSLRRHLHLHWERYGLATPTDAIENGIHASASPLEAVADRCLWWNISPEQDVLGRLLLQHGVGIDFLHDVLQNPPMYARGATGCTLESIADAFTLAPRDPVALIKALRQWQSGTEVALLPCDGAAITCPRPLPLPKDEPKLGEELLTETQQRRALVDQQSRFAASLYQALPLESLIGTPVVDYTKHEAADTGPTEADFVSNRVHDRVPHHQHHHHHSAASHAVLTLSPSFLAGAEEVAGADAIHLVLPLVQDILASHGVTLVHHGSQSKAEAHARRLFDGQHRRLLRHAMRDSGADLLAIPSYRAALEKAFGDAFDPASLRNAVRLAETFDLTPHKVNAVWKYCHPIIRLDDELFVGKVPAEDLFAVNGFALHERNVFYASPAPRHFLLVEWGDATELSYTEWVTEVVGDANVEHAARGSLNAAFRDEWQRLGFTSGPHPFLGVVHGSNSALAAMYDRQQWLPRGLASDVDPLGRRATSEAGISPFILRWALSNPIEEPGTSGSFTLGKLLPTLEGTRDGSPPLRLMDLLAGQGADITLRLLSSLETNYRCQQDDQQLAVRNTAFLLVKPHALGSRFSRCVEAVLARHHIRIDEEGDITGATLQEKNLLRTLYPARAAYAARSPRDVVLSHKEQFHIEQSFGVAWADMIRGGLVFNAYEALDKLGGFTPQQLFVCWRVSRRRTHVRPDLELAFLEGHDIFVVNGYFPALKQSFESPHALLHWYVVSWPESVLSWAQFQSGVIGDEDPAEAAGATIRGQLQAHWRRYGLRDMPDRIQNGLHVSSGPWHAMAERLQVVQPQLACDPLGDLLLRRKVHRGLVLAWLANPDIVAGGITAGVVEHLAGYDTTQVANLVTAVSETVLKVEKARKAHNLPPEACVEAGTPIEVAQARTPDSALLHPPQPSPEGDIGRADWHGGEEEGGNGTGEADGEAIIAYRNAAVVLVKPHVANNPAALQLLRDTLVQPQRGGLRILSETAKEDGSASAAAVRTLDQMYFTEAFYGQHRNFAAAAAVPVSEFTSKHFQRQFAAAFEGEDWQVALSAGRVVSAAEVMQRLSLTAEDLYQAFTEATAEGGLLRVGHDLSFIKVTSDATDSAKKPDDQRAAAPTSRSFFVANADYPMVRLCLQYDLATGEEAGRMRAFVVAWDERELSWRSFRENIIGDENPAAAAPESFRGRLRCQWHALGLSGAPTALENGVRVSDGPLQAYAERVAWFGGTSGAIPDTLARSLTAAKVDAAVLLEWSENPIAVEGGEHAGDPQRLFDLLHDADTADVIALAKQLEDHPSETGLRVLPVENTLRPFPSVADGLVARVAARRPPADESCRPQRVSQTSAVAAHTDGAVDIPTATFSHCSRPALAEGSGSSGGDGDSAATGVSPEEVAGQLGAASAAGGRCAAAVAGAPHTTSVATVAAAATPAKPRQKLQAAKVRDALLHARSPTDVHELWTYYVDLDAANEGNRGTPLSKPLARASHPVGPESATPLTISSDAFKADFASLEMFGAPLPRHQLEKLFTSAEARGRRMRFDEFARALAAYQAM